MLRRSVFCRLTARVATARTTDAKGSPVTVSRGKPRMAMAGGNPCPGGSGDNLLERAGGVQLSPCSGPWWLSPLGEGLTGRGPSPPPLSHRVAILVTPSPGPSPRPAPGAPPHQQCSGASSRDFSRVSVQTVKLGDRLTICGLRADMALWEGWSPSPRGYPGLPPSKRLWVPRITGSPWCSVRRRSRGRPPRLPGAPWQTP